jgi:GNAT superfamily N-acetyltransferase
VIIREEDPGTRRAQAAVITYIREVLTLAGLQQLGVEAAAADVDDFRPPAGTFAVALDGERVVGCIALRRHTEADAEIKRMWVAPTARGGGLGTALLAHAEERAGELGYRRVVLDTNDALTAAMHFYARHGYKPIGRYNDNLDATHFFAKRLTDRQGPSGPVLQ